MKEQIEETVSLQDKFSISVGARLRSARMKLKLTQQDVADALGTSPQMVSFLEKGVQGYIIDYLIFLRKKGVDINRIFSDTIH